MKKEEKELIKVRLSTVILCFIIFVLVVAMAGMYLYYNKKDHSNKIETKVEDNINNNIGKKETIANNINENTVTTNNTSKTEELDINSELVKKLYNYVVKHSNYDETSVYQCKKVTNKTISEKLKMITVFNNITKDEADNVIKKDVGLYNASSEEYIYNKETIVKKAKEIFNIEIQHKEFDYEALGEGISYKDGLYEHYYFQGGGDVGYESIYNVINAEKQGDELYIYDKYIHKDDINSGNILYYKDSEKKNTTTADGYANYKHTFKKNSDGSYYWYSTEPVENK